MKFRESNKGTAHKSLIQDLFSRNMLLVVLLPLILNQVNAYEYPVSDKLASASDRVAGAIAQVPGMSGIVGPSNVAGGQQQQQRNYGGGYYESNPQSGVHDQSQVGMQQPQQQESPYNSVNSGPWGVQNQTQRPQDLYGRPNANNPWENRGVSVQVQLRSYRNQDFRVDRERLCTCPPGNMRCIESSPTRSGYTCLVSFTVIVSSADSSVQYRSTPYVPLNQYGNVQPEYMPSVQQIMDFQLENQPTAVDVFVHNLGAVINAQTGIIEQSNTVTHIDTFVKGLNETLPSQTSTGSIAPSAFQQPNPYAGIGTGGGFQVAGTGAVSGQQQQANLVGTLLGTQLSLTYSVSCRGRLVGPGCDLQCNASVVNSAKAVCVSSRTGYFSLCEWTSGANSQVARCQNCPWGIKENAYCMDERGGVLESEHAGVVSAGYQTATIILATVAGLLLLCLLASCIYNCIGRRKNASPSNARNAPGYNAGTYHSGYRTHTGEPEATALNVAGNPNFNSTPTPAPRVGNNPNGHILHSNNTSHSSGGPTYMPPPLNTKPNKSAMRSPLLYQLPPAAHLGGSSLNDTLNSSFAGSHAVPPSVSADV